jgi:hypothetical protein
MSAWISAYEVGDTIVWNPQPGYRVVGTVTRIGCHSRLWYLYFKGEDGQSYQVWRAEQVRPVGVAT